MIYSILRTTQAWLATSHRIRCSNPIWRRILAELGRRSDGHRESGAFLLGRMANPHRVILDAVYYDDIAPESLHRGAILFPGHAYSKLWELCRDRGLEVVADVHTHPGGAQQSPVDRAHPMLAEIGHVALIVPDYARSHSLESGLGIYEYAGAKNWIDHNGRVGSRFFLRTV